MRVQTLRRTALALCAAFVLVIAFSIGITVVHAGHHCANGRCAVCVAYQGAQYVMRIMGLAAFIRALALIRRLAPARRPAPGRAAYVYASPVSLNIRMND